MLFFYFLICGSDRLSLFSLTSIFMFQENPGVLFKGCGSGKLTGCDDDFAQLHVV